LTSGADSWLQIYEDETFEQQIDAILEQLMPLYKQLHGYVRHKLHEKYGHIVNVKKPIPMHLLGNMWGSFLIH
jgi:peptidyl-dipeptidase A